MFRALFELVVTIIVVLAVRAMMKAMMKSLADQTRQNQPSAAGPQPTAAPGTKPASSVGDLHRDPVCGTFVAESTRFKRQSGSLTFYYCSETCKEKHALVAR